MKQILILLILLFSEFCFAQKIDTLYFKLEKGKYLLDKLEQMRDKRLTTSYVFGIPCTCKKGGLLAFYNHDNPEFGEIQTIEPVKTISRKQFSGLRFISFQSLVTLMKENDNSFNRLFTLYFVEAGTRKVYHVLKRTSFADDYPDVIPADTTARKP